MKTARSQAVSGGELDWEQATDWPNRAVSSFVDVGGERWHVQRLGGSAPIVGETGDFAADDGADPVSQPKPQLLLLHGTAASTHSWAGLFALLADRFDVLAVDLPGHGFTTYSHDAQVSLPGMAGGVSKLCDHFGFAPDIAVGHSAGAAILARMCIDKKIAPRTLISLNGALLPFPGMGGIVFPAMAKLLFLNSLMPRVFAWQARDPKAVERVITGTGSRLDSTGIAFYTRLFRSPRHVSAALAMMAQWDLDGLKRDLPRLATPLVLVTAEHDKAVSPDKAFKVRELVPSARVEYVRGLGHLAHEEDPRTIAEIIFKAAGKSDAPAHSTAAG